MVPSDDRTASSLIDRREAIRRAALLAGVALAPEWLMAVDAAFAKAPAGPQVRPVAPGSGQ